MRILPALLIVATAPACMGGSGAATRHAVPEREQHAVPTVPGTDCLATWNAPANRATRQATLPRSGRIR